MTQEEYNQLNDDYTHCAGTNCPKANSCLHHTAYTMLHTNTHEHYTLANPQVITGKQPCPIYEADRKERFAWGISRIYDNVRTADLRGVKLNVISCFGASVYYKIKQQRRAISEEEQQEIRLAFTEMGYDGNTIEFDHYEEQYPAIMRIVKY
nr:DUF6078 family protein [uncultured Prevotella sp.]